MVVAENGSDFAPKWCSNFRMLSYFSKAGLEQNNVDGMLYQHYQIYILSFVYILYLNYEQVYKSINILIIKTKYNFFGSMEFALLLECIFYPSNNYTSSKEDFRVTVATNFLNPPIFS